ncbi:peptidoglycan-binding domain-containing protein [Streptomyces sp. NPDC050738]|uniref:peptidoglycan-binding domain-containing protein n=1 Tax=Streptomyces sp. NPDC050738 TaxID=3154744 RepID=UPI0034440187
MTLWTSLDPTTMDVEPGASATARLRVRNTGDTVEEYRLSVVGAPAGWTRIEPETLRLYPGAESAAEIIFAPPRSPDTPAGPAPYGIRVEPRESPELRDVVEGQLTVGRFAEIRAELLPPTLVGRLRGHARIAVDNLGNTPLTASLSARDASAQLLYDVQPLAIQAAPGRAAFARLTVRPQRIRWTGQPQPHQLTVAVRRSGDTDAYDVSGTFEQRPVFPRWVIAVGGLLATAGVAFAVLWLGFSPKFGSAAGEARAAVSGKPVAQGGESGLPAAPTPTPTGDGDSSTDAGAGGSDGGAGAGTGSGSGSGADKSSAPAPGSAKKPAGPPWKPGYQPDIVVEFAQRRLAAMSSSNPCRLTGTWTPGVIDTTTEKSLVCYQKAVETDGRNTGHNTAQITATDPIGTLGRATLTSLWAQSVDWRKVQPGADNFQVTQVLAAFWWASQAGISDDDLVRDRAYAQQGVAYWKSGGTTIAASRYDTSMQDKIKQYQASVHLKATGVVDAATVRAMVGGSVNKPGVAGR